MQATLAAALIGLAAPPALAGDNVVLVELFTSQGCSSCPPADANLATLTRRDDVLALSMHVDYWDYLGWRDTFATPQNTRRQYAYRDIIGARFVYTPQMIVHGRHDVPGYNLDRLETAIETISVDESGVDVAISEADGMLSADISMDDRDGPCTVWIASYRQAATVEITRGENADEKLTYHNVVDKLMRVGSWDGATPGRIDLPRPAAGEGVAIWIQNDRTGRILAASFRED